MSSLKSESLPGATSVSLVILFHNFVKYKVNILSQPIIQIYLLQFNFIKII